MSLGHWFHRSCPSRKMYKGAVSQETWGGCGSCWPEALGVRNRSARSLDANVPILLCTLAMKRFVICCCVHKWTHVAELRVEQPC